MREVSALLRRAVDELGSPEGGSQKKIKKVVEHLEFVINTIDEAVEKIRNAEQKLEEAGALEIVTPLAS